MPELTRWDRIAALLEESSALPEDQRKEYLRQKTDGDFALQDEVLSLLAVENPAEDILETTAMQMLPSGDLEAAEALLDAPQRLALGQMLARRFRVERFLGRGGMAEVYAASDLDLNEMVAIKLLHPDLAGRGGFLDRFRREIRLARSIAHPNVARVYDLLYDSAQGGLHFFAMELLEGETLSSRLRAQGPMPPEIALPFARQLAAGLTAAHRANVIHRDFKPANVMLVGDRAVITDFGLAAEIPAAGETRERESQLLGTPGYVAPEQWTGQPASPASDVYSFGVVLRDIVGDDSPAAWKQVIDRCLEPDPKARWQSPADAVAALEAGPQWPRRKVFGILAAVSLGGIGLRSYLQKQRSLGATVAAADHQTAATAKIMLAPIGNQTGDAALNGFGVLLRDQLSQSSNLFPLQPGVVQAARSRMGKGEGPLTPEVSREVAMREGAPLVALGELKKSDGGYALNMRLELTSSDPSQAAKQWRRDWKVSSRDDVFQMASMAGDWIRATAGENPQDIQLRSKPPHALTTNSWEALRLFVEAEKAQFAGERTRDVVLYKEALKQDENFALACYRIADLLMIRADFDEGLRYWDRALALSKQKGITTYEMLKVRRTYYDDTWQNEALFETAQLSVAQWPKDYLGHFFLAMAHSHLGRGEAAVESLRTAVALEPASEAAWYQLCSQHLFAGRFAEVRECLAGLRKVASTGAVAWQEGKLAFFEGRYDEARRKFEDMAGRDEGQPDRVRWRVQGRLYLAMLDCELDRWPQALEGLRQGIGYTRGKNLAGEEAMHHYLAAQVCAHLGDAAGNRDHAEAIERASPGALSVARAGLVLARGGWPAEAKSRLASLGGLPPIPRLLAARHALAGELALANRDFAGAKREFEARAKIEPAEWPREYLVRAGAVDRAAALLREPGKFWLAPDSAPPGSWRLLQTLVKR